MLSVKKENTHTHRYQSCKEVPRHWRDQELSQIESRKAIVPYQEGMAYTISASITLTSSSAGTS